MKDIKPRKSKPTKNHISKIKSQEASIESSFSIVGIGASAGGMEALQTLFSSLTVKTNLAFVIIQHLDPSHESHSVDILSRSTSIPVHEARDGMHVLPNQIYVIPPGSELSISADDVLNVLPHAKVSGPPKTVDVFFEALAKSKKAKSIGIILSGTGSDGTLGLSAIKAESGITFAQNTDSAKFNGMPSSAIKFGAADFVLNPQGIAEELKRISKRIKAGTDARPSEIQSQADDKKADDIHRKIFFLVQSHTHIDFSSYKLSTVNRRIQRQMREQKQDSLESYVTHLQSHPDAVKALCEDIFIHVTEFFRDPNTFQTLKDSIFPRLVKNRVPGAPIRIWVPGCSTGEEAYSLAISLVEFLGAQASKTPIQIFATDISELAVQKARAAVYSEHEVEGVSEERLKNFFDKSNGGYKVRKTIRDMCVYSRHDVANNPPFAKIDLISCRNVLIYFASALQKHVMPIFHYSLNPHGFLLLGKSEAPTGFGKLFTLIDKENKVYSKINMATPMSFRFPTGRNLPELSDALQKRPNQFIAAIDSQKDFDRIVMSRYAPAGIVVNTDMEIIHVRGRTAPFLELSSGQPNYNFLKMVRPELLPSVRMLLQSAMRQNEAIRKEGLTYQQGEQRRKVTVEIIPTNPEAPPKERQFAIFFEDGADSKKKITGKKIAPSKELRDQKGEHSKESYIGQLLQEIDLTREYQQSLSEGYEATQEELTSANEELQSTNEELQSTNEEMETAKEELQAANEELSTINDELQRRNIELSAVNSNLAREKLYVQLFETITEAANEASSVDEALQIFINRICTHEKWSVGHAFLLSETGKWISTSLWYLEDSKKYQAFCQATENIEWTSNSGVLGWVNSKQKPILIPDLANDSLFQRKEMAAKLGLKSAFAVPVQIGEGIGAVLEFFSVKAREADSKLVEVMSFMSPQLARTIERKRALETAKLEEAKKSAIVATALDCIISMDQDGKIQEFNPASEQTFGYKRSEVIGREMAEVLIPPQMREGHRKGLAHYRTSGEGKIINKRLELSALRRDGSEFPIELTVTRIPGEPPTFTGFIKDITDRRRAEEILKRSHDELEKIVQTRTEELRKSEERFRLMVGAVKDYAIFMLDPNGYVQSWNEGAKRLKQYEISEIIGQHFSKFYSREDIEAGKPPRELEIAKAEGRVEDEGWRIRKDGTKFWANVVITAVRDESGTLLGFAKITRDLTEFKLAEEEVRKSRDQLEISVQERTAELAKVFEAQKYLSRATLVLASSLDFDQTLQKLADLANSAISDWCLLALAIDGATPRTTALAHPVEWKRELIEELQKRFPDDWSSKTGAANVIRTGKSELYAEIPDEMLVQVAKNEEHLEILRKLGMKSAMVVPIIARSKVLGAVTFISANSARIYEKFDLEIAEELGRRAGIAIDNALLYQQSQTAIRARDEFLSMASHELKTPLTSLKLQLQLVEQDLNPETNQVPSAEELSEAFDLSLRQVNSLVDLVEDFLDISRIQTGKFTLDVHETDLSELVKDVLNRFSEQLKISQISVELKVGKSLVGWWDRHRLEQVIVNLISNAIKYAPQCPLHISAGRDNEIARLIVEDSGPGIPKDKQDKIFDRFERANDSRSISGLGLGLFITRKIIEAHLGEIRLESDIGRGTKFVIELPVKPDLPNARHE